MDTPGTWKRAVKLQVIKKGRGKWDLGDVSAKLCGRRPNGKRAAGVYHVGTTGSVHVPAG